VSGLCGDCKHWASGVHGYIGDESYKWGDCLLAASAVDGLGKAVAHATENDHEGNPIDAVLITSRDFGCVQFEAKD
jgi:hypothetical protein